MIISKGNKFDGGMDSDSSYHDTRSDDYIYALNIRNGWGSEIGIATTSGGNELVEFELPDGESKCIGTYEDKQWDSVIYFLWNSLGNHSIVRFFPDEGRFVTLLKSPILNFKAEWRIHSVVVVDQLLYWTDAKVKDGKIQGNPPRKINMIKADPDVYCYRILYNQDSFPNDSQIFVNGVLFYSGSKLGFITKLKENFNDVVDCGTHIDFCSLEPIDMVWEGIKFFPTNHYLNLEKEMIEVMKPIPHLPPTPFYQIVDDFQFSLNDSYQFRYRYIFDDGEKSSWGSSSYVPTNFKPHEDTAQVISNNEILSDTPVVVYKNTEEYNQIKVEINDPFLSGNWLQLITGIEVAFRTNQAGLWKSMGVYAPNEDVLFRGDSVYTTVPSDDVGNGQSLKNFPHVPKLSASVEGLTGEDGETVMVWSGNLERYDLPDCLEGQVFFQPKANTNDYPDNQSSNHKFFKKGGIYNIGVVFEDFFGRQSPTLKLDTIQAPWGDIAFYQLRVNIFTPPPSWAKRYKIVVSQNTNQAQYASLPIDSIKLWKLDALASETEEVTTIDEATHISLSISNVVKAEESIRNFLFKDHDTENSFLVEPQDRIQFIYHPILSFNTGFNINKYNFRVAGYNLTHPKDDEPESSYSVFLEVDKDDSRYLEIYQLNNFTDYTYAIGELYRKSKSESPLYYEMYSGYIQEFDNDTLTNQYGLPILGAIINYGDTYHYGKIVKKEGKNIFIDYLERPNLYPAMNQDDSDFGRPSVEDPDYKEVFSYNQNRITDTYIPLSGVNGLSSFRGTEYQNINREFGPIQSIKLIDKTLLVVCKRKSQPIHIGRNDVISQDGQSISVRVNRLMNITNELRFDLGTQNPESIVVNEGRLYCYDGYKKMSWRYSSGNGQFPISEFGYRNYFLNLSEFPLVIGGFQRRFSQYYLTFRDGDGADFTLSFQEKNSEGKQKQKWPSHYSFIPEAYVQHKQRLFTFMNGTMWEHEKGADMNYYEFQYSGEITFSFNENPSARKIIQCMMQEGDGLWVMPSANTSLGETRLKSNKFYRYEGQWWADFLRNINDPRIIDSDPIRREVKALLQGEQLRGERFIIKITTNTRAKLRIIKFKYAKSDFTV